MISKDSLNIDWITKVSTTNRNSDSTNDSTVQSPFIVIQIPKSRKVIKFIANGKELGKGQELLIQN